MKIFQNILLFFLVVVVFFLLAVIFENRGGITNVLAEQPEKANPQYLGGEMDKDRPSPGDRITEEDIHVLDDKVIIDIMNPEWAKFTGTKSMDPVFDETANTIQIVPKTAAEIYEGDIVSYESDFSEGIVIHRVVFIGEDSEGWYVRLKGDNNLIMDPGKIRFDQIRRVTVGIIY